MADTFERGTARTLGGRHLRSKRGAAFGEELVLAFEVVPKRSSRHHWALFELCMGPAQVQGGEHFSSLESVQYFAD